LLGAVLLVGGAAHTFGVSDRYLDKGFPDPNRILLDVWIAEAQLAAGFFFVKATRSPQPRPWAFAAAVVIWSYALPFLPVLLHRARVIFWVMPSIYSILSLVVVLSTARVAQETESRPLSEA
jgi:hypothetical protein